MFFRRRPNAPPSDPYTSIPSQRSRRQSAPPKSKPALTISAPLSNQNLRCNDKRSGIAGLGTSTTNGTNGGGGMVRQRSTSDPELRTASSRATFRYGNDTGPRVGKSSCPSDEGCLGGDRAGNNARTALGVADGINLQKGTAIPVRKSATPSRLPAPTRIPGIAGSKSRIVSSNAALRSQHGDDSCSRYKGLVPSCHTTLSISTSTSSLESPRRAPNPQKPPQPPRHYGTSAPLWPERPWIPGQALQRKESDQQLGGTIQAKSQKNEPTKNSTNNGGKEQRRESPKRRIRVLPITKPDPEPLLRELSEIIRQDGFMVRDELDVDDVLAMHERDVMDRAGREEWVDGIASTAEENREALTVFGTPLRQVYIYASTRIVFGTSAGEMPGWELELPILIVSCVEEIWRRGAFDIDLYKSSNSSFNTSERERGIDLTPNVQFLVDIFNSQCTAFGYAYSLSSPDTREAQCRLRFASVPPSTQEIVSLLRIYLSSLPEPVFPPALGGAVWAWCVSPPEDNVEDDCRHVRIARTLLYLLPSPNFALLVYLLAFFRQVMRSTIDHHVSVIEGHDVNGFAVRAVAVVFGKWIFSSGDKSERGEEMMVWLLSRWDRISCGLLDIAVSAESHNNPLIPSQGSRGSVTGIPVTALQGEDAGRHNDSRKTAQLAPWMPSDAPGDFFGVSPTMDSVKNLLFCGKANDFVDGHSHLEDESVTDNKCRSITDLDDKDSVVMMPSHGLFEMDKLSLMRTTPSPGPSAATEAGSMNRFLGALRASEAESRSLCSVMSEPALEERLMDISFPLELGSSRGVYLGGRAKLPETPGHEANSSVNISSTTPSRSSTLQSALPDQSSVTTSISIFGSPGSKHLKLSRAEARIRALERQLESSYMEVAESIEETLKAREQITLLENRVKELELDVDFKNSSGTSVSQNAQNLEEKLWLAIRERDEALELVKMVKQCGTN